MAERVDVLIAGSGFGGSIAAYRLAELYAAAGADASGILVLERGERMGHTDFDQSMHIDHLSRVYRLNQGRGAQFVTASAVGGGSNLYLAASLRAPGETFERRDRHPEDGPPRRMWPSAISRASLNRWYRLAERGLRVRRPSWSQVSKSGGLWAATLDAAGHTCDRVPLAISPDRCVDAKWCHTGCIFGAKNSLITNYLPAAEALGARVRPSLEVVSVRQSSARPYRYLVSAATGRGPAVEFECKTLILATGAMGNAPILMRSRHALPSLSPQLGRHLGVNGDHVAAVEYDEAKVRDVLGLPGYRDFHKGKPITTMTYDFWRGQDGERFVLQEIFLSSLTNFLYDDGLRGPVLHGLVDRAHLAGRQPVAHDRRARRARRRPARGGRGRPGPTGQARSPSPPHSGRVGGRARYTWRVGRGGFGIATAVRGRRTVWDQRQPPRNGSRSTCLRALRR